MKVVDAVNSLPRPLSKGTKKMNLTNGASNLMLFATRDVISGAKLTEERTSCEQASKDKRKSQLLNTKPPNNLCNFGANSKHLHSLMKMIGAWREYVSVSFVTFIEPSIDVDTSTRLWMPSFQILWAFPIYWEIHTVHKAEMIATAAGARKDRPGCL